MTMTDSRHPFIDSAGEITEVVDLAEFFSSQDINDVEAAVWLARQLDGLTEVEEADLRDWLARDPVRKLKMEQLRGVCTRLGNLSPDDIATVEAGLFSETVLPGRERSFEQRGEDVSLVLETDNEYVSPGKKLAAKGKIREWPKLDFLLSRFSVACMAALVIVGGWMGWSYWQQQPLYAQKFATLRGQQLTVRQPDGSTFVLDTATRLDVAHYRQRREVHLLQGNASFQVEADPARPFHVMVGAVRITVLGTRFSVRHIQSYNGPDGRRVSVVVEEGRVRVSRDTANADSTPSLSVNESDSVILTAGHRVVVDERGSIGRIDRVAPASAMAWRDGRVVFDGTPLSEAIAEIERYVDTGLVITDPTVAAMRLNGSFDLRQVQVFKRVLPQALSVRLHYRAEDGKTEVVAAN